MVSAPVQAIGVAFMPAGSDQPLDIGLHQQLQDALGHRTQKVTVAGLLQKLVQWQSVLGHRGLSGRSEVGQLHPRPPAAVTTPALPEIDRKIYRRSRRKLHHIRGRYPENDRSMSIRKADPAPRFV